MYHFMLMHVIQTPVGTLCSCVASHSSACPTHSLIPLPPPTHAPPPLPPLHPFPTTQIPFYPPLPNLTRVDLTPSSSYGNYKSWPLTGPMAAAWATDFKRLNILLEPVTIMVRAAGRRKAPGAPTTSHQALTTHHRPCSHLPAKGGHT